MTLPAGGEAVHEAVEDAAFYWVHDEPMLRYLGARAESPTFRPTLYRAEDAKAELEKAAADPHARNRSRISVLLANRACDKTLTVTPTLWAMFGILPVASVQLAHRHQSVALDLIIDCKPGCYTLVGQDLDDEGQIIDPDRMDWKPASAFVTPPGYWHAHYNESGATRVSVCRSRTPASKPTSEPWTSSSPAPRLVDLDEPTEAIPSPSRLSRPFQLVTEPISTHAQIASE